MPIPAFDALGLLPLGVHDCTLHVNRCSISWSVQSWTPSGRRPNASNAGIGISPSRVARREPIIGVGFPVAVRPI